MVIQCLIIGWILTFFHIDYMFREAVQSFVDFKVTNSHYYIACLIFGVILDILILLKAR